MPSRQPESMTNSAIGSLIFRHSNKITSIFIFYHEIYNKKTMKNLHNCLGDTTLFDRLRYRMIVVPLRSCEANHEMREQQGLHEFTTQCCRKEMTDRHLIDEGVTDKNNAAKEGSEGIIPQHRTTRYWNWSKWFASTTEVFGPEEFWWPV